MNVLMGVGNEMKGDDGVGPYVAQHFQAKGWESIDCAIVPENYVGKIQKLNPKLVVLVDATDMKLEPGAIRLVPREQIGELAISTHSLPLGLLMDFLAPTKVVLIGIQPKVVEDFVEMSEEVKAAANQVIQELNKEVISFSSLEVL